LLHLPLLPGGEGLFQKKTMGLNYSTTLLSDADQVISAMTQRLNRWAEKAPATDRDKIQARARELVILRELLTASKQRLAPIIISEDEEQAYQRGYAAAKRRYDTKPGRRSAFDQQFRSREDNEAYRRKWNGDRRHLWADHH
jgi:hypothetical protein